jgi:hypothetical protein
MIAVRRSLPPTLAQHVQKILEQEVGRLSKSGAGRPRGRLNARRDIYIVKSIQLLLDEFPSLKATWGRESKRNESACSLVKQGLALAGLHISERAVERIWEEYSQSEKIRSV